MNKRIVILVLIMAVLASSCNDGKTSKADTESAANIAAVGVLQKKLQLAPDSLGIRYQLMNALAKVGQYEAALLQNDTLLMDDNENAPVLFRRGSILLETGDTTKAITQFQLASAAAPMFSEPLLQLAAIYANQGNPEALKITDVLIKGSQEAMTTSQARFIKGLYYSNLNNKDSALIAFDECIQNDYTFLEAYIEKGLLLYDSQQYEAALTVFERAIQVSNTFAEAYYQAGRCKAVLGDKIAAKDLFEKAVGLDNSLEAAKEALKNI